MTKWAKRTAKKASPNIYAPTGNHFNPTRKPWFKGGGLGTGIPWRQGDPAPMRREHPAVQANRERKKSQQAIIELRRSNWA